MNVLTPFEKMADRDRLSSYIDDARALPMFRSGKIRFDDIRWDLRGHVKLPRSNSGATVGFQTLATAKTTDIAKMEPLPQPLQDTIKAFIAHQIHIRGKDHRSRSTYVGFAHAIKYLSDFMVSKGLPTDLLEVDASFMQDFLSSAPRATIAYSTIGFIRELNSQDIAMHLSGVTTISPKQRSWRAGRNEAKNSLNLTHEEALCVARAFYRAEEPYDQFVTSILALLMCAPARVGELWRLPANLEVVADPAGKDDVAEEAIFAESEFFKYGLRWFPEKGGKPTIKFVPEPMVRVAREAIDRLRNLSNEARETAKWIVENPGKMKLPTNLQHVRERGTISRSELQELLQYSEQGGSSFRYQAKKYPSLNKPVVKPSRGTEGIYDFGALEKDWWNHLRKINPDWPYVVVDDDIGYRLRADKALLIGYHRQYASQVRYHVLTHTVAAPDVNLVMYALIPNHDGNIFKKLDVKLGNGSYPDITTHKLRRWLNTIAQRAGVPQSLIAEWSGRANIMQNIDYDYRTPEEVLEELRKNSGRELDLPAVQVVNPSRSEYLDGLRKTNFNSTPFGYCIGDLIEEPCRYAMSCLSCTRFVCVKGANLKLEKLKEDLTRREEALRHLEERAASGKKVNPRRLQAARDHVEHGKQLIATLSDSSVEDGTLIRNSDNPALKEFDYSRRVTTLRHERLISEDRKELDDGEDTEDED